MSIFSFVSEFAGFSNNAMAIDLGTVNTLIAMHGAGVVLNEATAVAVSAQEDNVVLAVGNEAVEMCGRAPSGVVLRYPFKDGVIADYSLAQYMIHEFFRRAIKKGSKRGLYAAPRVLLCVPSCITEVEKRAVCEAVRHAGAREVMVTDEVMAACVGSDLPYSEPVGSMIVDVGGGTSDAAVVVMGGIAVSKSIRTGGNHVDRAIISCIRKKYNVVIGEKTAQMIKCTMGKNVGQAFEVSGLNLETGLPKSISVSKKEVETGISSCISEISNLVHELLSITPPELAGDVIKNGIMLCGGGAKLYGLSEAINVSTGISVKFSPEPMQCVALGALKLLDNVRSGKCESPCGYIERSMIEKEG